MWLIRPLPPHRHPEPGGITAAELLAAVSLLSELTVVAPMWWKYPRHDPVGITAMLAAKVIRELILAFACPD